MKKLLGMSLVILCLLLSLCSSAQNQSEPLELTKQGAHYVFSAKLNNKAEATILLESGIPAMLVDSAFVFNSGVFSDLELHPMGGKEKMNLGGRVLVIAYKAKGSVRITDQISYKGEVFVLSGYTQNDTHFSQIHRQGRSAVREKRQGNAGGGKQVRDYAKV